MRTRPGSGEAYNHLIFNDILKAYPRRSSLAGQALSVEQSSRDYF
jgi:hypothetical protein